MENVVIQIYFYFNSYLMFVICIFVGLLILTPSLKTKRSHFPGRTILSIVMTIGMSVLCCCLSNLSYAAYYSMNGINYFWLLVTNICVYLLMYITIVLAFYFVFDMPFREVLVVSSIAYLTQHFAYQLNDICFSMATNQYIYVGLYNLMIDETSSSYAGWLASSNGITTVLYIAVCGIVYAIFYFAFARRFKANYRKLVKNSTVCLLTVSTLFAAILFNSVNAFYGYSNYVAHAIIALSLMFVIILLYMLILSDFMLSNTQDELFTTETYYKEKLKQYEEAERSIELLNIKAHDLKKEVETLRKANENISDESLKAISDAVENYEYTFDTGNEVLDVLLTDRAGVCRSRGIELTAIIDGNSIGFMNKGETFSLFSNILDNAIEAVVKLNNPEEKIISLSVKKEKGFIKIVEANYYSGIVEFNEDLPQTNKEDKENHGYGTKSIAYVVNQLNGFYKFETHKNIFTLTIIIPVEN